MSKAVILDEQPLAEIDVWWLGIDVAPDDSALLAMLNVEERARHNGYRDRLAARMFLTGAAMVRCLASRELSVPPHRVVVDRTCRRCGGPHGRPYIVNTDGAGIMLHFSVSHSTGWVGVAVAREVIGLDVQAQEPRVDLPELGRIFLSSAEQAVLESAGVAASPAHLLVWWTRKEAALKLNGTGLTSEPGEWSLQLCGDQSGMVEATTPAGTRWPLGLRSWVRPGGLACSVASLRPADIVEHDAGALLAFAARTSGDL